MTGKLRGFLSAHGTSLLAALGLFAATLWLFWPATGYDFLNFDDDRYVSGNHMVRLGLAPESIRWALRSVYESYWLPVMWLSYLLDTTLFGTKAFGYHFTNVLLHALNAALLFLLLRAWTRKFWLAAFVAAVFAWHPLRVESVAWVSERKDVLSGLLVLLCLALYKRFARNPVSGREVPAALCMALGLMTKPILVTLPFLLLLLDYWPLERYSLRADDLRAKGWTLVSEKVLFWALAVLFSFITYYTQRVGDAVHDARAYPWGQRLLSIPAAYLFYLEKTFFPFRLSAVYGDLDTGPARVLAAVLVLAALTLAALALGRRARAVPVGWFWFLGLLVPVIGIVRVGVTHVADRFTYLPSIGLGLAAAWGATLLPGGRRRNLCLGALAVLLLVGCAWQTRRVLPHWRNSVTAFENVLQYLPDSALANNNYGEGLLGTGQTEKALFHFDKAIARDPNTTPFIANSGLALILLNRTDEAIARLETALAAKNPNCLFLNFILGLAWMEKGQADRAIPYLVKANEDPLPRPSWRVELARAYLEAGRAAEASNEFARVSAWGWGHLTGFDGMCTYYTSLWLNGNGPRAWTFFEQALKTHPDNISLLNNVAWFLATDPPPRAPRGEALRLALRAKELCAILHPGILDTLAAAYAAEGRFDEAVRWAEEARAMAQSNGLDGMAEKIAARKQAYRDGKAWGPNGPVSPVR